MNEEKKILFKPEFELYHSLLSAYGEDLIENFKQKLLSVIYHDDSRILEFGKPSINVESISFINDGLGNVIAILSSGSTILDDGLGNVTITGVVFTDDNNGNVVIS